ncbi:hypothetical protein [Brassicibacter mesophilus]
MKILSKEEKEFLDFVSEEIDRDYDAVMEQLFEDYNSGLFDPKLK